MKENKTISFQNATITKEDGEYVITETCKDELKVYNLSNILDDFLEVENIKLQLAKVSEIPSEE